MSGNCEELIAECEKLKSELASTQEKYRDSNIIAVGKDEENLPDLRIRAIRQLKGHLNKVYAVSFCKSNGLMCSASQDGKMYIWDTTTGIKTLAVNLESQWVMTGSYAKSGSFTGSGGLDNMVTLHTVNKGKDNINATELTGHSGFISGIEFIDDTKLISSSGASESWLWDINTHRRITEFNEGHDESIESLALSEDGKTFFTGGIDTTIKMWDVNCKDYIREFKGHTGDVNDIKMFPGSGNAFGSASDDGTCIVFDKRTDVELNKYILNDKPSLTSCDFSKSGRLLFVASNNAHIYVLDTLKGNTICSNIHSENENVTCLATSSDGYAIASSGWSTTVKLWSLS